MSGASGQRSCSASDAAPGHEQRGRRQQQRRRPAKVVDEDGRVLAGRGCRGGGHERQAGQHGPENGVADAAEEAP
jgi:hypothetical protein